MNYRSLLTASCVVMNLVAFSVDRGVHAQDYDYPIDEPLAATVIGTPVEQYADIPTTTPIEERRMLVFEDRQVPGVFWYTEELHYGVALQSGPAPLAFVISGTGGDHRTSKMQMLVHTLYAQGAHVVTLPSPTHTNFIVAASSHGTPGDTEVDVSDLYRVMQKIREEVETEVDITGYLLTGYSMGGFHSAFVAEHDARHKAFNFDRVLLLNPPISLFESALRLDQMLIEGIPGGLDNFDDFFDNFMRGLSDIYVRADRVSLSGDALYRIYQHNKTKPETLEAIIGISFRLSGLNMIFAADVINDAGYIVPKGSQLTSTSSLTEYIKVGSRLSFKEYVEELFFPLTKLRNPDDTIEGLIEKSSLRTIEDYLREAPNVSMLTNTDDIILGEGDIDWFGDVFGDRARFFPNGGHMGNFYHRDYLGDVSGFFQLSQGDES